MKKQNNLDILYIASALFFLLGFFSTLQIFKYNIFGFHIYPIDLIYYSLIFMLLFYNLLNKNSKIEFIDINSKTIFLLFFFFYYLTINILIPIIDQASTGYVFDSLKLFLKRFIFLFFVLLIFLSDKKIKDSFIKNFLNGFFISILFHAIYSLVVAYFWYIQGKYLHTEWMGYFGITAESVGHSLQNFVFGPMIRLNGFHWDPAYFGLWGAIGIFIILIKKLRVFYKFLLLVLIFFVWILTFSRSGFFAFCITLINFLFLCLINNSKTKLLINKVNIFLLLIITIISISIIGISLSSIYKKIDTSISLSKILERRIESDTSTQRHLSYPINAIEAISVDPVHLLFGYGSRNSGRSFNYADIKVTRWGRYDMANKVFDIESDLFRCLINTGIIGFTFYILITIVLISALWKKYNLSDKKEYILITITGLITTFFAGFFYGYNDSLWFWMFYLIALLLINDDILKRQKNEEKCL
ncbi:MAG: O-antigen ligase family protein [Candidatus Cloacimonetes bacterium]|nr:O-antigen ligase family protein [Candidatus Cloacimonadota bacterium]